MSKLGARGGLSLLELLVVIAIIGVLIALLIPAVQKIRERAIEATCENNLKQMALAARHYESQMGVLPPGYIGPKKNASFETAVAYGDPADNQWVGHLPMLLPHLEQASLYSKIAVELDPDKQGPPWWEPPATATPPLPANYEVATQSLPVFLCPLNPNARIPFTAGSKTGTVVGFHVYFTSPFSKFHKWVENYDDGAATPHPWQLGKTNYVGICGSGSGSGGDGLGGSSWWGRWEGVYTNRSKTKISMISDGASNTLLYGEVAGTNDVDMAGDLIPNQLNLSWFGVGVIPSSGGLERGKRALWNQFSSYHASSVPFAFVDGSVRNLRFETDATVFLKLGGMKDGSAVTFE